MYKRTKCRQLRLKERVVHLEACLVGIVKMSAEANAHHLKDCIAKIKDKASSSLLEMNMLNPMSYTTYFNVYDKILPEMTRDILSYKEDPNRSNSILEFSERFKALLGKIIMEATLSHGWEAFRLYQVNGNHKPLPLRSVMSARELEEEMFSNIVLSGGIISNEIKMGKEDSGEADWHCYFSRLDELDQHILEANQIFEKCSND